MAQAASDWVLKKWNPYNYKHRVSSSANWTDVVDQTKSNGYPAKYVPAMTDREQKLLEISCIRAENLIVEKFSVRAYFMKVGRIVGASDGEETRFIYVEHRREGPVHGRPMTEDQLKKKGALL